MNITLFIRHTNYRHTWRLLLKGWQGYESLATEDRSERGVRRQLRVFEACGMVEKRRMGRALQWRAIVNA